jgi:hypothetical protein
MGTLVLFGGDFARDASGREQGNLPLKGVHPSSSSHSHQRPFAFELSALLCRRSRHGLARPLRALPA